METLKAVTWDDVLELADGDWSGGANPQPGDFNYVVLAPQNHSLIIFRHEPEWVDDAYLCRIEWDNIDELEVSHLKPNAKREALYNSLIHDDTAPEVLFKIEG